MFWESNIKNIEKGQSHFRVFKRKMILVVAEKPSVGRTLASIVGADNKEDGYFEGNNYVVTWAIGHLIGLFEPNDYSEDWVKWSLSQLPIIPERWKTKVLPDTEKQYKVIEKLINRSDLEYVINAGDSGQEGELIQRHIYNKAMKQKVPVKRLWISSMTTESIIAGLKNLKDSSEYDNLYHAGLARAMSDWLIGINGSRLFTCIFQAKPPLATGRVQSPTLSEIVNRHLQIVNFKPEDYYILQIFAGGIHASWFNEKDKLKSFSSLEDAQRIYNKVQGKMAKVIAYKKEQKKEQRPQLHNLASLQQEASRVYKYSAQDTLKAAQSLYEKKLSTYPRTDSKYITKDMMSEMEKLMISVSRNATYQAVAQYVLKTGLNIDKRVVDDEKVTDHTALLPTTQIEKEDISKLSQMELNVFHLIVSRFVLAMARDYVYYQSTVVLDVENETFKATGRVPIKKGFKSLQEALFPQKKGKGTDKKDENPLENASDELSEGQQYSVEDVEIKKKQTTPPAEYTDGTLIAKMENPFAKVEIEGDEKEIRESLSGRGLGTPATRGNIIEELIRRGYINREKDYLIPTERGIKMVEQVLPENLKKPDMTAEWEYKLHLIAKGEYNPQDFVNEVKEMVVSLVDSEKNKESRSVRFEKTDTMNSIGVCPKCKSAVYKHEFKKDGIKKVFYSCENNKKENGTCDFIIFADDKFVKTITGGELKESSVKSLLKSKDRKFKATGKKKDGSGTYSCYIVMKSYEKGRIQWKLEFTNKK